MFILREILLPLKTHFSNTDFERERASLSVYTLLSITVPFTSSMTSNCYRCLETLFGICIKKKRFYTFMTSPTLPWFNFWRTIWSLIPSPQTEGRIIVALDDFINPKVGKNIFGCETIFDHAAKTSTYVRIVMLKSLKHPVRVVWVFRRTRWITLFTTDLELSVTQIIEYYGAEKKIESGFKELKQDIGSQKSQCRNAQAVNNHLNFCMMASTITWIYADRLKTNPEPRHKVKGKVVLLFQMFGASLPKPLWIIIFIGFALNRATPL